MFSIYPVLAAQTRLPFYLSGAGVCDPEYHVVREGGLVSFQILYTTGGTGILRIDGKELVQTAGSIFYLSPGVPHEYFPVDGKWKTSWVVFRGQHLQEIMQELGFGKWHEKSSADISGCEQIFSRITLLAADIRIYPRSESAAHFRKNQKRRTYLSGAGKNGRGVHAGHHP